MDISTDNSSGTKFGDLKKEQRYKRLERDLRLEYFKRVEKLKADINKDQCLSPTWPSLSTINTDNLDSSCTNGLQSLQVSRVESEVISSSTNLYKVFPMPKSIERMPMATSSVKHFPIKDYDKDRVIMPPPSTSNFLSTGTRRSSALNTKPNEQTECRDSPSTIPSAASCSSYQEENLKTSHNSTHSRAFYRWKVLLNAQGQLIIKGTLDCGKVARSKPIIHRLSSTTVQSIYKHTYILNGPITDEKEELPDYIRGKFHNGFPDDWENVYQLWTNYVSEGCKETFRWPTPITDSDDDLYSEITDFSYFRNKQIECRRQVPKIFANNASSLGYHSRTQSDSNFNSEKTKDDKLNNQSYSKLQVDNKSNEDSGHSSEIKDSNLCNHEHEAKNVTQDSHNSIGHLSNSNLKNASFLSQIIKEEKLRIIMSNLGNENCPPQYLDKLIELSDCLRYILSYTPDNCTIDGKKQDLSDSRSQIQVCERCNNNTVSLIESSQEDSSMKLKNKNECVQSDNLNKNLSKVNDQVEHTPAVENLQQPNVQNVIELDHNSSDSDSCMGVPHIPADRLIQPKSPRLQRYKDKRNRNRERNDGRKSDQIETQVTPVSNMKALNHDDSSVSITEDEFERRKNGKRDHHLKEPFSKHANVEAKLSNEEKVGSFNENGNENINTINHLNLSTNSSLLEQYLSEPTSKPIPKSKPVIKTCVPAHYKLTVLQRVRKPNATLPDITILSENASVKARDDLSSKHKNRNENVNTPQEKLQKDILKHPFLSYDSEDYFNEKEAQMQIELPPSMSSSSNKIKEKKISSIEKNKESSDDVLAKQDHQKKFPTDKSKSVEAKKSGTSGKNNNESFGSENNPKLLTSWVPYVDYDEKNGKLSLKFEGKLLNERAHVLHRKFLTDPIIRRHSSKLIETEKNEYFSLVGDVSDTKHVVPKELLKQCSTGCPSKIQKFCQDWKKLSSVLEERLSSKPYNLHDISIDHVNVPISARGRRVVPSLDYWNGERLVNKCTGVVYTPGNSNEIALESKIESAKKTLPLSEKRPGRNNTKKDANLKGSMSSKASRTKESSSGSEEQHSPLKRRFAQQLTYSSSEKSGSDCDPDYKPKKFRKPPKEIQSNLIIKTRREVRQEINMGEHKNNQNKKNLPQRQPRIRSSRRTPPEYEWSYEKEECHTDILSDDQASVMK